jgi:hypothetical protein
MSEQEIAEYKAEKEKDLNTGFARWNWFAIIEKLAKGDITKFDEIYKQNFILALNLLSYWQERDREIARIRKAQEKK